MFKGVEIDLLVESGQEIDPFEIQWTQHPQPLMTSALQMFQEDAKVCKVGV